MKPTIEYIREHFEQYNRQMFGGTLPVPPIHLTNARTYMGQMVCKKRVGLFGKKTYSDFRLRISKRFDFTEQELQDTIIHEMIHYYIGYNQLQDTSSHGAMFRKMMDEINRAFDRHITISHRTSREERLQVIGDQPRPRIFAILTMNDGHHYIKVVPRIEQRIVAMHRRLASSSLINSIEWYFSTDPFFALFPSSMGTRVQRIDWTEVQTHLTTAMHLRCDGCTISRV